MNCNAFTDLTGSCVSSSRWRDVDTDPRQQLDELIDTDRRATQCQTRGFSTPSGEIGSKKSHGRCFSSPPLPAALKQMLAPSRWPAYPKELASTRVPGGNQDKLRRMGDADMMTVEGPSAWDRKSLPTTSAAAELWLQEHGGLRRRCFLEHTDVEIGWPSWSLCRAAPRRMMLVSWVMQRFSVLARSLDRG